MILSRRVKIQLAIFILLSALGIAYAGFSYVGVGGTASVLDKFPSPRAVTASPFDAPASSKRLIRSVSMVLA